MAEDNEETPTTLTLEEEIAQRRMSAEHLFDMMDELLKTLQFFIEKTRSMLSDRLTDPRSFVLLVQLLQTEVRTLALGFETYNESAGLHLLKASTRRLPATFGQLTEQLSLPLYTFDLRARIDDDASLWVTLQRLKDAVARYEQTNVSDPEQVVTQRFATLWERFRAEHGRRMPQQADASAEVPESALILLFDAYREHKAVAYWHQMNHDTSRVIHRLQQEAITESDLLPLCEYIMNHDELNNIQLNKYRLMKENEQPKIVNVMNGNNGMIIGTNYGTVNMGRQEPGEEPEKEREDKAKEAINALLQARDEHGNKLFVDKSQWYAVYRVLHEKMNYPERMSAFCESMEQMGFGHVEPPCVYTTIRSASSRFGKLSPSVSFWSQYVNLSDAYAKQCAVTDFLLEKLGL